MSKELATPKDLNDVMDSSEYLSRQEDKGIINPETGAGVSINANGDINLSSSEWSQYKMSNAGVATEVSMQSNTITNTKNLRVDNLAINRHRINPALWELTDFKKIDGSNAMVVGNLTMTGTVLVKAWEPSLKKYVLIRRPVRMPLFSTTLDIPDAPENLNVDTNIGKDLAEYLLKLNKED